MIYQLVNKKNDGSSCHRPHIAYGTPFIELVVFSHAFPGLINFYQIRPKIKLL